MSDLRLVPLPPPRRARGRHRALRVAMAIALTSLGAAGAGCGGAEARPAAHPDFRALQVGEARVAEHTRVAEDEGCACDERRTAAARCDEEVARLQAELADVRDADASERLSRLERQCAAARGTLAGRCGPDA